MNNFNFKTALRAFPPSAHWAALVGARGCHAAASMFPAAGRALFPLYFKMAEV